MLHIEGPWMTESEVAMYLGITARAVRFEYRTGRLGGAFMDAQVLYPFRQIEALKQSGKRRLTPSMIAAMTNDIPREDTSEADFTVRDVARTFGVSRQTVFRWVANGMAHYRAPGGRIRFTREQVDQHRRQRADPGNTEGRPLTPRQIAEADRHGREIAQKYREWRKKRDGAMTKQR